MFSPLAGTISQSLRQSTSGDSKIYAILSSEASTLWNLSVQWQSWELVSFTDGTYSVISVITQLASPEVDSLAKANKSIAVFCFSSGLATLFNDRVDLSRVAALWTKSSIVSSYGIVLTYMLSVGSVWYWSLSYLGGFVHRDWPTKNWDMHIYLHLSH